VKIYRVGGSVRDELLGLPIKDRDYVVVGATVEDMLTRGFRPVGKEFPVFLHPDTQEEYALARTERKTGRGYKGFTVHASPEVTLEQDLERRDLTINAIARAEDGTLIDPFGGASDLRRGILRHVSAAFVEDPVRILRVARFAARFRFEIAPQTLRLMRDMVAAGEADHLVPERIWQELARGLMENRPSRMFEVLRACGALARIIPELEDLFAATQPAEAGGDADVGHHTLHVLDYAAARGFGLEVRFAALLHDAGKGAIASGTAADPEARGSSAAQLVRAIAERVRASNACRDLAMLAAELHPQIHGALGLSADAIADLFHRADALRRPDRFTRLLEACEADACGRPGHALDAYRPAPVLRAALEAARGIDAGAVARGIADGQTIAARIRAARVAAIAHSLARQPT
jgi:tRNA nucleotidyltransferase (CCA-adding enzyme)